MAARTKTLEVKAYAVNEGGEFIVRLSNGWDANTIVATCPTKENAEWLADDMNRVLATAGSKVPA